jgi:hypothetical protein
LVDYNPPISPHSLIKSNPKELPTEDMINFYFKAEIAILKEIKYQKHGKKAQK